MAELTASAILNKFYRLVGTLSSDQALVDLGEAVNAVAFEALTEGVRDAQLRMLDLGYGGWRKRSSALTFSGTDDADGGKYVDLPTDFLRAFGSEKPGRSALVEADGTRWGRQIDPDVDDLKGDGYYIRGEELWLARQASPPGTVYLDYHYEHPEWSDSVTIDFPARMRGIIAPCAAKIAMDENWIPGDQGMKAAINNAVTMAENRVRKYVRATKAPRRMQKPPRIASRW